jgi:NitT/TauT family transport system ATP-binding protein
VEARVENVIEIVGVSKTFEDVEGELGGSVVAIRRVDLQVRKGEFVSLLGPSGCGKSTLLDIIGGLERATTGSVAINGSAINGPDDRMAMVFQQTSSLPWRTVLENVELGLEIRGVPKDVRRTKAQAMLELVGLQGFENKYPSQLSGGMNQRVAIARALTLDPEILLMDEPFGALDEQTRRLMGMELLRIWSRTGKSIVFVTHSIGEAIQLSDRIMLMSARPSTIREEISVPLPRPRNADCLITDIAKDIEHRIWAVLMEEVGDRDAPH